MPEEQGERQPTKWPTAVYEAVWESGDKFPLLFADQFYVLQSNNVFYLVVGQLDVSPNQVVGRKQTDEPVQATIRVLAKVAMAPDRARQLATLLNGMLQEYDRSIQSSEESEG